MSGLEDRVKNIIEGVIYSLDEVMQYRTDDDELFAFVEDAELYLQIRELERAAHDTENFLALLAEFIRQRSD